MHRRLLIKFDSLFLKKISNEFQLISYYYSIKIEGVIPVRFLLNVVETRPEHFRAIRSPLVYLCGLYYPYMLPTVDSLLLSVDDELKNSEIKSASRWAIFCLIVSPTIIQDLTVRITVCTKDIKFREILNEFIYTKEEVEKRQTKID